MGKRKDSLVLLFAFAIFINPIILGSIPYICYVLVYGIPVFYIIKNSYMLNPYFRKMPKPTFMIVLWTILALVCSIAVPIFKDTNDFTYIDVILAIYRRSIILIFLFILVGKFYPRDEVVERFMLYYAYATILYIFSTVVFMLFPGLKDQWITILQLNSKHQRLLTVFGYAGRFGWSGFSGYRNTIDCTLSVVFLTYLFGEKNKKTTISTSHYICATMCCFVGNMFYGRSGTIASILCIAMSLVLYGKIRFRFCVKLAIAIFLGIGVISIFRHRIDAVDNWFVWATSPIKNYIQTGSFNNYSADHLLKDMIFVPEGKTFWLGDGKYTDHITGSYYMRTDSGFMRQILFWGVTFTAVTYLIWVYSLLQIKRGWILQLVLLCMCVVFEIKGEAYYELLPLFTIIATMDKKAIIEEHNNMNI